MIIAHSLGFVQRKEDIFGTFVCVDFILLLSTQKGKYLHL